MAGPWEKYQQQSTGKPWEKFAAQEPMPQQQTPQEQAPAVQEEVPTWRKALDYAARGLDYPGGLARTTIAQAAELIPGISKDLVTKEDWGKAFHGQAPKSSEYMERAGVPEGDVVNYPLVGDVSSRDIAGFGVDVVTDPLTAIAKTAKFGTNILDRGVASVGTKIYKSGLKKIDQAVLEKGAKPFSDLMLEHGASGTTNQIRKSSEELLSSTKSARDELHTIADVAGVKVDPAVAFKSAIDEAVRLGEKDPGLADLATKLKEKFMTYVNHGPVPLSQASEWKTNLYNAMPESAFDKFGKLKGPAQRIEKLATGGLRDEIINTANKAAPGLGEQINKTNETMQTILAARKPLKIAAKSAKSVNMVTPVDAILGGLGATATHDPVWTAALVGTKKLADLSKTTAARTVAGKAMTGFKNRNVLTRGVSQSPWVKMTPQENQ